ncbi:hypothetical protein SAMN04487981_103364 [Streptomyces sp. cf386]|uniref:hypothetical protein n=1 Tax=Streptomyces sp. cf386 TaxID=1761904 RepID=UPI000885E14E|nr:hypothetical protein [Streptomyces sp. cf386]SDN04414.1 hypothetical protein SAMN04487981_103364 [Streptomyces sp. cf386]
MSDYGFARASDEVLAVRNELADEAVQALRRAGLPAFLDGGTAPADRAGAVVQVEPDAETASAPVSVGWRCDPGMVEAAVDSLTSGGPGTPAARYPGMIGQHMQSTLIKILLSAGVIATPDNDTMSPERVLVFGMMSDLPPALRPTFVPPGS